MVTSQTAIIYSYVLYLIGVFDHGVEKGTMRQAIAEFFLMASLTGRYTNSPETAFEFDLAQLRELKSGEEYIAKLRQICAMKLTTDFWEISLPNSLATSAARSPSRCAYQASLILLEARALQYAQDRGHGGPGRQGNQGELRAAPPLSARASR
jgi:hypothetical protein